MKNLQDANVNLILMQGIQGGVLSWETIMKLIFRGRRGYSMVLP